MSLSIEVVHYSGNIITTITMKITSHITARKIQGFIGGDKLTQCFNNLTSCIQNINAQGAYQVFFFVQLFVNSVY